MIDLRAARGIPLAGLRDLLHDLFGLSISEGALVNVLAASAAPFRAAVSLMRARRLAGTALASDETGAKPPSMPSPHAPVSTHLRRRSAHDGYAEADIQL